MNTMPPRCYFRFTSSLLLGLLLCILAGGAAMADPKVCKKNCPPLPQMDDNHAWWGNNPSEMFYENGTTRTCELALMDPEYQSGTYDCQLNAPWVTYDISNAGDTMTWEQLYKRGDQYWCDRPEVFYFASPDLQYSYSWTGDCTVGCDVTIVNRISANNTGIGLGNVTFEALAQGVQTTDPVPFVEELHLDIDYLQVTKFADKGKDKVLAICGTAPVPGTLTFHISPVGATPQ